MIEPSAPLNVHPLAMTGTGADEADAVARLWPCVIVRLSRAVSHHRERRAALLRDAASALAAEECAEAVLTAARADDEVRPGLVAAMRNAVNPSAPGDVPEGKDGE